VFLLDPCKKVVGGAAKLDASEGSVAAEVAADADIHFVLIFESGH